MVDGNASTSPGWPSYLPFWGQLTTPAPGELVPPFLLKENIYNKKMDILKLNEENMESVVEQAVEALKQGKVLVCPTDTVYGLVADATNKKAVQRVFDIKGREEKEALPVFVRDITMAKEYAVVIKEEFLQKHWPGKVTFILKSRGVLPVIMGTAEKIGLRVPDYAFLGLILKNVGVPITGTSANVSGQPSLSSAKEVIAQFEGQEHQADIIIDAGVLPFSEPSSVVDLTGREPVIIRKGAVLEIW